MHPHNSRLLDHLTMAATVRTGFAVAALRSSGAFTLKAGFMTLKFYRLANTFCGLFQSERDIAAYVTPFACPPTPPCPASTKEISKDISKRGKDIFHIRKSATRVAIQACVAVLIVARPFLSLIENFEGL